MWGRFPCHQATDSIGAQCIEGWNEGDELLILLTGLAAGAVHVVSGPDHLAALAPIAADHPSRAARLGIRWGLGHGASVCALGVLGLLARDYVDVQAFSQWSEFAVGFVLIAVGLWALRQATRLVVHHHEHTHENDTHTHLHIHPQTRVHAHPDAHQGHNHAAFFVGALHGAAGTGHLFGVLPSLALPTEQAVFYLGTYVLGAVGAMAAFGYGLGRIARWGSPRVFRGLLYGSALCAIGVGIAWIGLPAH